MDEQVVELLTDWGFSALANTFKENCISMEVFPVLTPDLIKELIPAVGTRIMFANKYKAYLNDLRGEASSSTSTNDEYYEVLSPPTGFDTETVSQDLNREEPSNELRQEITQPKVEQEGEAYQKKCAQKVDIRGILQSHSKGLVVLAVHEKNRKLTDHQQDLLVEVLIENEIKDNMDQRMSVERFELLANAIVGLFPSQSKDIYFSRTLRKIKGKWTKVGGGKLYQKFYNTRRTLRDSGLLSGKRRMSLDVSDIEGENHDLNEYDESVGWLMNSTAPWTDVITHWENTHDQRVKMRDEMSILQYINKFPALKMKLGYTLLELDFQRLYSDKESHLFANFEIFASKIIDFAKASCQQPEVKLQLRNFETPDLSKDLYNIYILTLLPQLLKPTCIKRNKTAGIWKPTKLEVSESFILHVKIPGEIKNALERRAEKLKNFGLTFQPIPVIVGETIDNIAAAYVAVDNLLYQVPTVLKAIDVTFKVIHSLNASYSAESEQVWLIIQKGLYKIDTVYDKTLTGTNKVLAALK